MKFKPKSVRTKLTRLCLRLLAVLFGIVVVISVALAVTLIITQKPVDLSDIVGTRPAEAEYSFTKLPGDLPNVNYTKLTIQDLLMGYGRPGAPPYTGWLANDDLIVLDNSYNFIVKRAEKNFKDSEIFIKKDAFLWHQNPRNVIFSSDGKYVAYFTTVAKGYRHSNKALYSVAEVKNNGTFGNFTAIGPTGIGSEPLQLLIWNPKMGAKDFVFVYENNLYYQEDPFKSGTAFPITTEGNKYKFFGISDWLYEEEIFATSSAIWWSPSGESVAFASFDDENVSLTQINRYDPRSATPYYEYFPYPKPGTAWHPVVDLFLWDKSTNTTLQIPVPEKLNFSSKNITYLFSAQWIVQEQGDGDLAEGLKTEHLLSIWSNRVQNEVHFNLCNQDLGCSDPTTRFEMPFEIKGQKLWSEPADFHVKAYSSDSFFVLLPREFEDGNIYNHIARVGSKSLSIEGFSGGPYDIKKIVGYDEVGDEIYFLSAAETIGQMHLFRIPNVSTKPEGQPICMSCVHSLCLTSDADFSPSGKYYLLNCLSPFKTAEISLWNVRTASIEDTIVPATTQNFNFELPKMQFEKIRTESGIDAHVGLLLPPELDKRYLYPVVLYTYAGPNTVLTEAKSPWNYMTYLANKRQYIIVTVDGTGSGNRGWNVKEKLYMNLGTLEVEDQIDVVRKLAQKYSYMDAQRVAAFGWSYGGFVTAHIGARDAGQTFRCIIAVAPVVDFRFYDSAYTERYMGLPQNNTGAYEKASLLSNNLVEGLRKVKLLLAHGDADDNVHYQNSALLAEALQQKMIRFRQLVYTNQDHSLHDTLGHLYKEVDHFLLEDCFNFTSK